MSSKQSAVIDIDQTLTSGPAAERHEIWTRQEVDSFISPKYEVSREAEDALLDRSPSPNSYYTPDEFEGEDGDYSESSQYDSDGESSVELNDDKEEEEEEDVNENKAAIQLHQLLDLQWFIDVNVDKETSDSEEEVYYDADDQSSDVGDRDPESDEQEERSEA
ncbi:hypothetical protein HYPSUDRAFT_199831 [Hypholoma sublateritium FD-334 SS-4]|uniref:Transcription factor Iwr1 domain-containing protein n=1 Tax=Hypholoma sublateritium (strain FD-334 SS-4) TaxID=945553 RepID=A0A0D2P9M7_HYPSF|nr:hypothetical protein HYPSUDRAFT_199831 [Hypholoma sublateritium FD-334 SS-4]